MPLKTSQKKSKTKYAKIGFQRRKKLISKVMQQKISITSAAQYLKIKLSTAKSIIKRFKQTNQLLDAKKGKKSVWINIAQKQLLKAQSQNENLNGSKKKIQTQIKIQLEKEQQVSFQKNDQRLLISQRQPPEIQNFQIYSQINEGTQYYPYMGWFWTPIEYNYQYNCNYPF